MWLHDYLDGRADLAKDGIEGEGPKNSGECVAQWATFSGLRPSILSSAGSLLKGIQDDYKKKFFSLPENIFTRAMLVFGLLIGPIAPLPIVLIDIAILMAMACVFVGLWAAGGTITLILAGLSWIVGGNKLAESTFEQCTNITEDCAFFILNLLRIPAGLGNLIGLIPSFVLELITESLNYVCITAVHSAYNCNTSLANTSETQKPSAEPKQETEKDQNSTKPTLSTLDNDLEYGTIKVVLDEPKPTMVPAFDSSNQAKETIAGDILSDVARETLGKLNAPSMV